MPSDRHPSDTPPPHDGMNRPTMCKMTTATMNASEAESTIAGDLRRRRERRGGGARGVARTCARARVRARACAQEIALRAHAQLEAGALLLKGGKARRRGRAAVVPDGAAAARGAAALADARAAHARRCRQLVHLAAASVGRWGRRRGPAQSK